MNNKRNSAYEPQKGRQRVAWGVNPRLSRVSAIIGIIVFIILVSLLFLYTTVPFNPEDFRDHPDTIVLDRSGGVLRHYPDENCIRHLWISITDIPEQLIQAFLAAEDARFFDHSGYDARAILRAVKDNLMTGQVVSGASTITQQTIKQVYPAERTYLNKIRELVQSIILENTFDKNRILEEYLNRIYMGNNIRGVNLAARVYFRKSPRELNLSECCILASLPRAPGYLNPYGPNADRLLKRKNWVLWRMRDLGHISGAEYRDALLTQVRFKPKRFPMRAPHFLDIIQERFPSMTGIIQTTLDYEIQNSVEDILLSHRSELYRKGVRQAAVVAVHNPSMEIVSMAGSFEYDDVHDGYNNGATALRSPGSTLKPFAYALALESGYTASTLLSDVERMYASPGGNFLPANFDRNAYGPVTMRTALSNSLNLAAIRMLGMIGYNKFYRFLDSIHLINFPSCPPDYYGLGLVVGNPEVTLEQLTASYAMLANNGLYTPVKYFRNNKQEPGVWVLSPESTYIITDMLADAGARSLTFGANEKLSFGFPVSFKTGTSTHYRDNWIIGYTELYTVGVWAGNFDGSPTNYQTGASSAGIIFKDVMNVLHRNAVPGHRQKPALISEVTVCTYSGLNPTHNCPVTKQELFIAGTEPEIPCSFHLDNRAKHSLDTQYASWLFEKNLHQTADTYKLTGFPEDLDTVFRMPTNPSVPGMDNRAVNVYSAPLMEKDIPEPTAHDHQYVTIDFARNDFNRINNTHNTLEITSPLDNDRFVTHQDYPNQSIQLAALSSQPAPSITWFVDGMEYADTAPPYQVYWNLQRGLHTITVIDRSGAADSVSIMVE